METKHKDILDRNRVFLIQNLELSSLFYSYLISDNVLRSQNEEEICAEKTEMNRARLLVDTLKRRGPNAFSSFLKTLLLTQQTFIAHKLDPLLASTLEHVISIEEDEEERRRRGDEERRSWRRGEEGSNGEELLSRSLNELAINPTDHIEAVQIRPCGSLNLMSSLSNPVQYDALKRDEQIKTKIKQAVMSNDDYFKFEINYTVERPNDEDDPYPCHSTPRGVVYILNVRFEGVNERVGSDVDESNITSLFINMGYSVEVIKEDKLKDIRKKIEQISRSDVLSRVGIFVMFLMSHGKKGYLFDSEHKEMRINQEFVRPFSSDNCRQLVNKPKLFFIQACRGDQVHFDQLNDDKDQDALIDPSCPSSPPSTHPATDIFKLFSTPEDYKSIRLSVGSLFIRCLVLTIAHFCHQKPFEFMVRCVTAVMDSINVEYRKKGRNLKQVSIAEGAMTKDVFFNPLRYHDP